MPVFLAKATPTMLAGLDEDSFLQKRQEASEGIIDIALLNNMPDAAVRETERQFLRILDASAQEVCVRLTLVSLPEIPRGEETRRYIDETYSDPSGIWSGQFDGMIVTGTEPRAGRLSDEPYWQALAKVIDHARSSAMASIWSCLAAHAAVLYMDGIERYPLPEKCSGVFKFEADQRHQIMSGITAPVAFPHSRYNGLQQEDLVSHGYTVLTQSMAAGVDTFVKESEGLMVFFQGHPEYGADTLLREYRRDVGRFLRGEREILSEYPARASGCSGSSTIRRISTSRSLRPARRTLFELPGPKC